MNEVAFFLCAVKEIYFFGECLSPMGMFRVPTRGTFQSIEKYPTPPKSLASLGWLRKRPPAGG